MSLIEDASVPWSFGKHLSDDFFFFFFYVSSNNGNDMWHLYH